MSDGDNVNQGGGGGGFGGSKCEPGPIPRLLGCDCDSLVCALVSLAFGIAVTLVIVALFYYLAARKAEQELHNKKRK